MKTKDLTGPALEWAVATCENQGITIVPAEEIISYPKATQALAFPTNGPCPFRYSTNWSQGGPIIEREKINVNFYDTDQPAQWGGSIYDVWEEKVRIHGPTPLVAAMRCYVASKLGDDVEIPEELR